MIRAAPTVAIILLAAGRSSRTDGLGHKLLADFEGMPLVRRMASAAGGSRADHVVLVTGHDRDEILATLEGIPLQSVHNDGYRNGLSGSIARGIERAEMLGVDGALMLLADMPFLSTAHLDKLIKAFRLGGGLSIVRATGGGRPGNPLLLPAPMFPALRLLAGDRGAKDLVRHAGIPVLDIEIGPAAHVDVDTPEALLAAGGSLGNRTESAGER